MLLGVRHNAPAWAASHALGAHASDRQVAAARLASGLRIATAADDAAGLAVSEGLRSTIGGSRVALRNVQDGIGMVRTAEGALGSVHQLVQRMRDLAVRRGNADALGPQAVATIDTELQMLRAEAGRTLAAVSGPARRMLDGSTSSLQVGPAADDHLLMRTPGLTVLAAFLAGDHVGATGTLSPAATNAPAAVQPHSPAEPGGPTATAAPAASTEQEEPAATNPVLTATSTAATTTTGSTVRISGVDLRDPDSYDRLNGTITYRGAALDLATVVFAGGTSAETRLASLQQALDGALGAGAVTVSADGVDAVFTGAGVVVPPGNGGPGNGGLGGLIGGVVGVIGGTGGRPGVTAQEVQVSFTPASAPTPVRTQPDPLPDATPPPENPPPAPQSPEDPGAPTVPVTPPQGGLIASIDAVLDDLSLARAYLGAVENRLGHTASRLGASLGASIAAESRICDADHALEASHLVRAQLRADVASAMLAHALRTPEQLLSLLR
ncbi:hypothetical protein KLP28_14415 [Nocardioidaceae bacterium]|nr:hypothetical protein KLP28_14415 [Nocardioidaceae bacterium]